MVGGAHNALVAAAYLARAGRRVVLLEARDELGGAVADAQLFPGVDARVSRFSYSGARPPWPRGCSRTRPTTPLLGWRPPRGAS